MTAPNPAYPLIIALDYPDAALVWPVIEQLTPPICFWKVGLELFVAAGPDVVQQLKAHEQRVFLDLKLHDIPNTVVGACRAAAALGVDLLTLHASGGVRMLQSAVEAVQSSETKLLAVTLLTSLGEEELRAELGVERCARDYVLHLARLAQQAGVHGVVCSPWEAASVREVCGPNFLIVTPGIRLPGAEAEDQRRVCTPGEALRRGADYLVIGRTVTQHPEPRLALAHVLADIASTTHDPSD
ncbi:orotidine-5'-phosphate decarboxylase [Anthocerotibacter panamensis]|uniref:orotidine-5'-phosphate decarboxylase n=1 Tax=Anthocerotibacter panamensis TaxID=2857077 RepID=UPI001C408329|nr:orotidine-5'-phosphate decarboxylase [Anthocerotibacter panamensis]